MRPGPVGRALLPVLGAAAAGGLVRAAWAPLGLPLDGGPFDAPFPRLWPWFFAICVPASFAGFTLLHAGLVRAAGARPGAAPVVRWAAGWDRASYGVIPIFLALMLLGNATGQWRLLLPAFFVGVLLGKGILAAATLYQGFVLGAPGPEAAPDPPALRGSLFAVAFLTYASLAPYVAIAVSSGGDEPIYLLNVQSLYADGDLDVRDNVRRGDDAKFYWGPRAAEQWNRSFVGFPALLLPGYTLASILLPHYPLAGRLGAMLTIALCAALLGSQTYGLCRDLGASRAAAFWAWLVLAFTPPTLVHSGHVYPEIPAGLLAIVGVRAVLRVPGRSGRALLAVAASAGAMVLLKDRYAPLALGLLVWALLRLAARRPRVAAGGLAGLLAVAAYAFWYDPLPLLFPNLATPPPRPTGTAALRAGLGLFVDQEFGLLYYAPQWAFALVGVPLLWRRHRPACLGLLGLTAFYLMVVVRYRWMRWFGGWTPSPRFVLAVVPLLAPFVAEAFDRRRGRALATLNGLFLVWTAAVALALSLVPAWRYDDADGRARLLDLLGARLGLDVARFLPSLVAPTGWTWAVLAFGMVGSALVLHRLRRSQPGVPGASREGALPAPRLTGALVAGVAMVWLGAAAVVPTWSIEGEAMRHSGGTPFQSQDYGESGWAMTSDGWIEERIVVWPGWTEVTVIAGAYTTTGTAPRMRLTLDGHQVGTRRLRVVQGHWVRGPYVALLRTGFGRALLRLEFADLVDEPRLGQFRHAYVDRIRLRRLPAAGDAPEVTDCVSDPSRHCPDAPVTRAELAALLLRAKGGADSALLPAFGALRDDLAEIPGAAGIEALAAEGVMRSCGGDRFCPATAVTRDEWAVILLRGMYGHAFAPPLATRVRFGDVAPTDPKAAWIEALAARALTCGCGAGNYCPDSLVTWVQAAQFLGRAFPGSYPPAPCRNPP